MADYFGVTDTSRRHSEVNKQADIRALVMDLKDSDVHTLVPGRTVAPVGLNKGKVIMDIFTEGKEVLEHGAFRSWKDRTGKFEANVFGGDMGQGVNSGADMGSQGDDRDDVSVEFDSLADPELEGEI